MGSHRQANSRHQAYTSDTVQQRVLIARDVSCAHISTLMVSNALNNHARREAVLALEELAIRNYSERACQAGKVGRSTTVA